MSTQEMQIPRVAVGTPAIRRLGFTLLVVVALSAGGFVGRSTAPTARPQSVVRPATSLSELGVSSVGDAGRAAMHKAMGRIAAGPKAEKPTERAPGRKSWVVPQQR